MYQKVVAGELYDPNISVTGTCKSCAEKNRNKLKGFVKGKTNWKLHYGKPLGGKGHFTQSEIDILQNYYGLTIRRNVNNLKAKKRAVWAVSFISCQ
jgi:hypothetical protein